MTIRKVLDRICKVNFPRTKIVGKIASHSQIAFTRFLKELSNFALKPGQRFTKEKLRV